MKEKRKAVSMLDGLLRFLLVVTVGLWVLDMLAPGDGVDRGKVAEFSSQVESLTTEELVTKIRASKDTPLLLMVYASWCSSCRSMMPTVIESIRGDRTHLPMNVLFVSVDSRIDKLASYLVKSGYEKDFTPYVLKPSASLKLDAALRQFGNDYTSHIPYIAIYNAQGVLQREFIGTFSPEEYRDTLLKAL